MLLKYLIIKQERAILQLHFDIFAAILERQSHYYFIYYIIWLNIVSENYLWSTRSPE